jgi:AraC-like DNA-binding protein
MSPDPAVAHDYRGELLRAFGHAGVTFGHAVSSGTRTDFSASQLDAVLLTVTTSGLARVRHGHNGSRVVTPAQGLLLLDSTRSVRIGTAHHGHAYLALPRAMVVELLGGDPVAPGEGLRALPAGGLTPFLLSHLQMLAAHGETLDGRQTAVAMNTATNLALACLRQLTDNARDDERKCNDAFFTAAMAIIDRHRGKPFTASAIAMRLGCSRAYLYRIFSDHGLTIAGYQREAQFTRAKALLSQRGPPCLDRVAFLCGYQSVAAFSRAFRKRFDVPPGMWRDNQPK